MSRRERAEARMLVQSPLLLAAGFSHGFSTRIGGVSEAPFDALNLGRGLGDLESAIETNRSRFLGAVHPGMSAKMAFEVSQVHGDAVLEVRRGDNPERFRCQEGDALVARSAGLAVGVRTADCVPVLLADPLTGAVAAVHAGWRGVARKIVQKAASTLLSAESPENTKLASRRLLAAIGPHIRIASFEVGEEVAAQLAGASNAEGVVDRTHPKPHVDLAAIVSAQLREVGVEHIDDTEGDTFAEPDRFFSYRRDGAKSGRHLSVIVAR